MTICTYSFHSKCTHKHGNTTRFSFHCAQSMTRQHEPQKLADNSKHRDKESMACFPCEGWLHITVFVGIEHGFS